ncbi:MAG: DNA/RNA helicase, partial [Bacillota bacterium]|nr:DNA/RNA helicase [Bacillota bacterium]
MRFIVQEDKLIPVKTKAANTLPLGKINSIPDPPLHPAFQFNPTLQEFLSGKQLLVDELPFSFDEIQNHYENGYLTYRKAILYIGRKPTCVRCGNKDL